MAHRPVHTQGPAGLSLVEVLIAAALLLITILTMVGYIVTVHRAANEGKRQALASMEARTLMERAKGWSPLFEAACQPNGWSETKTEYLLSGEAAAEDNELGHKSAATFRLQVKARHIAGDIYSLTVSSSWDEDGRPREVILESRTIRPGT